ncbi:MAG TPA: hypothetical protein VGG34_07150 [Opitutaceae bacterium]|jgi:hypothetical protein
MTRPHPTAAPSWSRVLGPALWAGAAVVLSYHAALVLRAIALAEPMGKWETVYASVLRAWPHEYQWGNFLAGHDNYGPGYPAYCQPFLLLLGDPYVACRTASLVALVLASAVFAWLLRRGACPAARAAAWTAVFFAANAGSYSLQSRPDFLVMLEVVCILAAGLLAAQGRLRAGSFGVILGALTLAGYLTKPYVLFDSLVALAYLGLQRRYLYAAVSAAVSGAILAAGVAAYGAANPYYWLETFGSHVANVSLEGSWFVHQCADFSVLLFAALAGALAAALGMVSRGRQAGSAGADPAAGYWLFAAAAGAGALAFGLGWHTGAYLTYFFHLLLAPLCLLAATAKPPAPWRQWELLSALVLLGNLAVLMALAPALPREDPGWEALRGDILRQPGVVLVDSIMEPLSRARGGVLVADSGMYGYALGEVSLVRGPAAALERARAETGAFERDERALLSKGTPAAIYLDCYLAFEPGLHGRAVPIPRNSLPWFTDSAIKAYRISETFRIRPYYFSTNSPRQGAGTWETTVVKLVRPGG